MYSQCDPSASVDVSNENVYGVNSAHAVARRIDKPYSTVRKIMRHTLKLFPYHLKLVQELQDQDLSTRLEFAMKCLAEIEINNEWLLSILWSDEAHFICMAKLTPGAHLN